MAERKRVLIVDDEYVFCKRLKQYLEGKGYEADLTTNGEQALDMAKGEKAYDVMTLDIRMPGMNGYEVLQKLKWENKGMSIIVISAIDVPDMEDRLLHAGASAVLRKPINLEELAKTIEEVAR